MTHETPLERICREAAEHEQYVLAHPDEFSTDEVERAALSAYQRERLSIASTLRYDD
jgi:ABC-type multidrug transport system fused ATPase/permease subunit